MKPYWLYRRMAPALKSSMVLMYHRIASPLGNPWDLCVSPQNFEKQLAWLKKNKTVLSLSEMLEALSLQKVPPNSVALTFDDGYADNLHTAWPLLKSYGLPATFFITNEKKAFWWDLLDQAIFGSSFHHPKLELTINGDTLIYEWERREKLYMEVWELLKDMPLSIKLECIHQIKAQTSSVEPLPPILSDDELKKLALDPNAEIGGHSFSHPSLALLSEEEQTKEILTNKEYLESLLQKKVNLFSYPHGSYNEHTKKVLNANGFTAAFTTQHAPLRYAKNFLQIGRYGVKNNSLQDFLQ